MKECPRCHKENLLEPETLNRLSRRAEVYICNECDDEEEMIDAGFASLELEEVQREEEMQREADFAVWCDMQSFAGD